MRIFQVDAFTSTGFTGNPATVVLDADGRDEATLQAIAREFRHAETAFVLAASGGDHDLRMRFFSARRESPFVGHATIAAHAVLLANSRRSLGGCRQASGTGIIDVSAARDPQGGGTCFEFRQSVPDLEVPLALKTTLRVAEALGLPGTQLHESLPTCIARKGSSRLLVPVAEVASLDALRPNLGRLESLGRELGAEGVFVFATETGPTGLTSTSRMFCPALGIDEDPVSGNAHAMLAAYLWKEGQIDATTTGFRGLQGRHVQRPGEVRVTLEHDQGGLCAVRIGGRAVIISAGTLTL